MFLEKMNATNDESSSDGSSSNSPKLSQFIIIILIEFMLWINIWNISDYIFDIIPLNSRYKFIINIIIAIICFTLLWLHQNNRLFK